MSYAEQEQDAREYAELKNQFEQERLLEPTGPYDGGYLLVDDDDIEEPVAFRSIEAATDWCGCYENYTVYKLTKEMTPDEFKKEVENIIFENFEVDNWYDVPSPVHDMDVGGAKDYEYFNGEGACCALFGSPRSWEERAKICADLWLDHRGYLFERELKH